MIHPLRFIQLFLLCSIVLGNGKAHCSDRILSVVTWNLQWFPGKSPTATPEDVKLHIAEVREAILKMDPDILVLQEVATEKAVLEALPENSKLNLAVMSRFKNSAGFIDGQQIAILSKFPADFVYSSAWKIGWAGPPRGFAFASLNVRGSTIQVIGLHLKSNLGDAQQNTAKREDAVEQILDHIARTEKDSGILNPPILVCGDFNTDSVNPNVPSERTFKMLSSKGFFWTFEGIPKGNRITCPGKGRYPPASFDHIFCRGLNRPVATPLSQFKGSDHFPVRVEVMGH